MTALPHRQLSMLRSAIILKGGSAPLAGGGADDTQKGRMAALATRRVVPIASDASEKSANRATKTI